MLQMTAQNDLFRENLTSSEIHRALLGREVLQLQNTVSLNSHVSLNFKSGPVDEETSPEQIFE